MKSAHLLFVSIVSVSTFACDSQPSGHAEAAAPEATAPVANDTRVEAPTADATPPTESPAAPGAPAIKSVDPKNAAPQKPAELTFSPPADWTAEAASNSMRKAQYKLPRAGSDSFDAELVVFHSGKMGMGPVEANLNRWASQFEQPDGSSSRDRLTSSTRKGTAGNITDAVLEGTYIAEKVMGSGEHYHEENWKLLGAILETEHGPYYFKLVGPRATIDAHEKAFHEFVASAK